MLAQKLDRPYDNERIIAEPKMDGIRLILPAMDGVKAYTRHGNEVLDRFPELRECSIPRGMVLDGELIVTDSEGLPDFERVMKRLQTRSPRKIERLAREFPVQYVVFDVLYHRGKAVLGRPLMERKAMLDEVIQENDVLARIRFVEGNATGLFQATGEAGLEGIVIKRKDSLYLPGRRSPSWQKVIHWQQAEVVITGYRKEEPGWLIASKEGGRLRPRGIMELGIGPAERKLSPYAMMFSGLSVSLILFRSPSAMIPAIRGSTFAPTAVVTRSARAIIPITFSLSVRLLIAQTLLISNSSLVAPTRTGRYHRFSFNASTKASFTSMKHTSYPDRTNKAPMNPLGRYYPPQNGQPASQFTSVKNERSSFFVLEFTIFSTFTCSEHTRAIFERICKCSSSFPAIPMTSFARFPPKSTPSGICTIEIPDAFTAHFESSVPWGMAT